MKEALDQSRGRNARILILDDQDEIAQMLSAMVRLIGHEPTAESNPQRALELVESENYDVIISDYRMPEMNGQQFYEAAVLARPELAHRILLLTGDLLNDETQAFLRDTGAPYLPKPFHLAKVQKAITDILSDTGTNA